MIPFLPREFIEHVAKKHCSDIPKFSWNYKFKWKGVNYFRLNKSAINWEIIDSAQLMADEVTNQMCQDYSSAIESGRLPQTP